MSTQCQTIITEKTIKTDFAVVGGGLAGLCAAVAAARNGAKCVLIQDRPVLGGNCSSEIRVWVGGAFGVLKEDGTIQEYREGGILEELLLHNLYINPTLRWTIWDHVLFQAVKAEPNITLLLNTSVQSLQTRDNRITSVRAWHLSEYCHYNIQADLFADCSGDSILRLSGAEHTRGREGRKVFNESFAPEQTDDKVMGSSIWITALPNRKEHRDFIPPGKFIHFNKDNLPKQFEADLEKIILLYTAAIETGGLQDTIKDADTIRDELFQVAYGFWEYHKNQSGRQAEKWGLDWISSLPGKRESFRYIGDHILTQNDIEAEGRFPDTVCHGGWPIDDHFPEGYKYRHGQTIMRHTPTPYGIPYRCLYSVNIENLFFAGRNISASHTALSSTRVMGTCAVMGQAVGTAAALAVKNNTTPRGIYNNHLVELQETLQDQDQFIPFSPRNIAPLSRSAQFSHEVLRDGIDRSLLDGDHGVWFKPGETCSCMFPSPVSVDVVRIVTDTDCNDNTRLRHLWESTNEHRPMPLMMARDFDIVIQYEDNQERVIKIRDNYRRWIKVPVKDTNIVQIKINWLQAWGNGNTHIFAFEAQ